MIFRLALLAMMQVPVAPAAPTARGQSYLFFVASEGSDEVALMRFDGKAIRVEHRTMFKTVPGDAESSAEIYSPKYLLFDSLAPARNILLSSAHGFSPAALMTGPRNLTIAPDGRWYFLTTSHGFPGSELLRVRIAADSAPTNTPSDTVRGQEALGALPGAVQITPDGIYAWVTNSTGAADTRTSWVSVVYLPAMVEAGRIPTCVGGRGSRFTPDGAFHYSLCSADDALVEIDARAMLVARRLSLSGGGAERCEPGALTMVPDGSRLFVTCRKSNEIVEVDRRAWSVTRRLQAGSSPDDLATTRDGHTIVVTHAAGQVVSLLDAAGPSADKAALRSPGIAITPDARYAWLAVAPTTAQPARMELFDLASMMVAAAFSVGPILPDNARAIAPLEAMHGVPAAVAISSDDRYAFVSFARSGGEAGVVEVIDLARRAVVASLDFGRGLAGIAFWKVSN